MSIRAPLSLWGAFQACRLGWPEVTLGFLGGIGDDLLCTAPIHEWLKRGITRIWFITRHSDLYHPIDRRVRLVPEDPRYRALSARLGRPFRPLAYSQYDPATDRDTPGRGHLIAQMCRNAGLSGEVALRPRLELTARERDFAPRWSEHIAVQSSSLSAGLPMRNKQWIEGRFGELGRQLVAKGHRCVQIGAAGDPFLPGCIDLRGRTSLRETAVILAGVRLFVGIPGFLMHLARAVETPAVIVYGGREPPETTGYSANRNLASRPSCSPCWQRNRCDFGLTCQESITVSDVLAAVEQELSQPRRPLRTDVAVL